MVDPSLSSRLSMILSRIVTPAWLLTGALFKLYYDMPSTLPQSIWAPADKLGVDLQLLLYVLIALEFVLFGIMVLSRRWARPVAIAVLTFFSVILIIEIIIGSDSCGCMGGIHTPPLLILIIDGVILIGELIFRPVPKPAAPPMEPSTSGPRLRPSTAMLAVGWVVASFLVAFGAPQLRDVGGGGIVDNGDRSNNDHQTENGNGSDHGADSGSGGESAGDIDDSDGSDIGEPVVVVKPPALTRPPDYYVPSPEEWVGKHWYTLDIAAWLNRHPADITKGKQYLIFYNPTCDHCHDLLTEYFVGELPAHTTVVAIPEYKNRFERSGRYPMPCDKCDKRQLRFGCDWIIGPPLVVALEDGIVKCATEAEEVAEPQCLLWH